MSAKLFFLPYQVVSVNAIAQPSATLTFYQTGSVTKLPIYSTDLLNIELPNPVTATGGGRFPDIYVDTTQTYRVVVKDKNGTVLDDVDPYIPGSLVGLMVGSGITVAATRTVLAGLIVTTGSNSNAFLAEAGSEGIFHWDASDLTAQVTADPAQGVYVAPATDTTGASGAWVRKFSGDLQADWFGLSAANSGAANKTAMDAAIAFHFYSGIPLQIAAGTFNHTGAVTVLGNYFNIYGADWGKTVFKPTGATESFILKGRYGRFADIGVDGRPDGVTKTGTNGIVLRDCNSTVIDNCDCRGFTNDGLHINPDYGGGAPGNNDCAKILNGSYNLNGRCGIGMSQAADNNNLSFIGVNCSSNTSHGLLAKSGGGYVDSGCLFEGNGGYGIQIGEDADISINIGWVIKGPWIEGNTLGGVRGSARSAGNLVTIRINSSGQIYSPHASASDLVESLLASTHRFGNNGIDWLGLSAGNSTAFVAAQNTSGAGNVDLWLQGQNAGVIRPQSDFDMASGKAIKVNGTTAIDSSRNATFALITASSAIASTSPTAGIGYATGAGGTVTQATSRTTGVTINKLVGAITLVSAAGTATWQTFTVTNSTVGVNDTPRVVQKSGTDLNMIHVTAVAAGSFNITFATTGGTTTEQPVFNFMVLKGVAS